MIFEILDKDYNFIDYDILDNEVSKLLNIPINDETYIIPKGFYEDWIDFIGTSAIISKASDWFDIISQICKCAIVGENTYKDIIQSIQHFKPFINICLYFQNKGYIPHVYEE